MLKKLLIFSLFLSFILLFFSSKSGVVSPSTSIIPSIISGLYPYFILFNLGLLILCVIRKSGWGILPIIAFILSWSAVTKHFGFKCYNRNHESHTIRVGTYNIFGLKKIKKEEFDKQDLVNDLNNAKMDIVCLQEANPFAHDVLTQIADRAYPHRYRYAGLELMSRFPIIDKGSFDFDSGVNGALWSDIEHQGRKLRVYCTHFRSNMVSKTTDELMTDGKITEGKTWRSIWDILSLYKRASLVRVEQAQRVRKHLDRSPFPAVVCGDLNDHPLSHSVREFTDDMKDSFVEAGCGWGTTYGGSLPLLRIDYILVDDTLQVHDHAVHPSNLSDHHLVTADIEL